MGVDKSTIQLGYRTDGGDAILLSALRSSHLLTPHCIGESPVPPELVVRPLAEWNQDASLPCSAWTVTEQRGEFVRA